MALYIVQNTKPFPMKKKMKKIIKIIKKIEKIIIKIIIIIIKKNKCDRIGFPFFDNQWNNCYDYFNPSCVGFSPQKLLTE